ncbi:MAG: PAS domain S-box protein, partial [Planctomycetota bacterium]
MKKKLDMAWKPPEKTARFEVEIKWEMAVNKAIAEISRFLIKPSFSIKEIAEIVQNQAVKITKSEQGSVSSIDPATGDITIHTFTKMMDRQCLTNKTEPETGSQAGPDRRCPTFLDHALNTRMPFYTNNPQKHPACCSTSRGHVPIRNFLSVPAMIGMELVGQISVANSPEGYTARHAEVMAQIAKMYAAALQRERSEAKLRASEEKYRAIFEQAADSVVLIDAKTGALVEFNDRTWQSLGYTRAEFGELNISDFEVVESAKEVSQHVATIVREGTNVFETKHRTKDGRIRDILVSCRAIQIGEKIFLQAIWRDITERKRTAEEFRRQGYYLEKAQQMGNIGTWELDIKNNKLV